MPEAYFVGKDYSPEKRQEMAAKGHAMPSGQFPIADRGDLGDAIQSWGRAGNKAAAKAHITKRARALKALDMLPADWEGSTKQAADDTSKADKLSGDTSEGRNDYLAKMYSLLKGKVTKEEWDAVVKQARGHAGGKARARARAGSDGLLRFAYYDSWEVPSSISPVADDEDDDDVQYEKSDPRINYRAADTVGETCQNCAQFEEDGCSCEIVEGRIDPQFVCDMFLAEPAGMRESSSALTLSPVRTFSTWDNARELSALVTETATRASVTLSASEQALVELALTTGTLPPAPHNVPTASFAEGGNVRKTIDALVALGSGTVAECETALTDVVSDAKRMHAWLAERVTATPLYAGSATDSVALFVELPHAFAESSTPPSWIPVLPKAGSYEHPKWGTIAMSDERIERFIANANAGVYQTPLPLDCEHQTKLSGAIGWLHELRRASWGGAEARVEWQERGKQLWADGGFRFVSPEWWDDWQDSASRKTYTDVLIGAALTTRPFFKAQSLRPLVATEQGWALPADEHWRAPSAGESGTIEMRYLSASAATPPRRAGATRVERTERMPQPQIDELTSKRFAELESQIAELQEAKTASDSVAATRATELKQANDRLASMELDAQMKRFTDVVMGRSGAGDGARFIGDTQKHVEFMAKLSRAFGEDSDEVKHYISEQQAHSAQMRASGTFKSLGSELGGDFDSDSASAELSKRASKLVEDSAGKLDYSDAITRVASDDPDLYRRYRSESYARAT
jgi:hypothetical protein